jgi:hypothetical protein
VWVVGECEGFRDGWLVDGWLMDGRSDGRAEG